MSDVYYSPEKFGLKVVADIDYSSGSYEFDLRVVWKHEKTGAFYTARDSGCSCPSPFESYRSLADLDRLDFPSLKAEVEKEAKRGYSCMTTRDASEFLATVEHALNTSL